MSKPLKSRVRVITVRIVCNTDKKDSEIVDKIAEALDLEVGDKNDVEQVVAISGWKGSKSRLGEAIL